MGRDLKSINDLEFDDRNANRGTEVGQQRLETSLRSRGAGRSILVDRNGKIIAGNKTAEKAVELGLDIEVVRTRGDKLVVVQREDLDLEEPDARLLAYEDNRIAQMDLAWDVDQITADAFAGIKLDHLFSNEYIATLMAQGIVEEQEQEQTFAEQQEAKNSVGPARHVCCPDCGTFFVPDRYYNGDEE
jgi:sulfur carrier protein ThiS